MRGSEFSRERIVVDYAVNSWLAQPLIAVQLSAIFDASQSTWTIKSISILILDRCGRLH